MLPVTILFLSVAGEAGRTTGHTKHQRHQMKTTTTPETIAAIVTALSKIHVQTFEDKSSDPKRDAQRNLAGKTHYVDDDTLRWHKSRVLSSEVLCGGLLLRIITSDALDMNNTRRGYRAVVFDLFGTTIERPNLDEASATKRTALKRSEAQEIDLAAHYRTAMESELRHRQQEARELQEALATLPAMEAQAV